MRVFDVVIEGTTVLHDFDIFAAAGGKDVALDRSFQASVTDGTLNLLFSNVVENPIVSAIEAVSAEAGGAPPTASFAYRGDSLRHSQTARGARRPPPGTSTATCRWSSRTARRPTSTATG